MQNDAVLRHQIDAVRSKNMEELREQFQALYGFDCGDTTVRHLRKRIIYRLQELCLGGVDSVDMSILDAIVPEPIPTRDAIAPEPLEEAKETLLPFILYGVGALILLAVIALVIVQVVKKAQTAKQDRKPETPEKGDEPGEK